MLVAKQIHFSDLNATIISDHPYYLWFKRSNFGPHIFSFFLKNKDITKIMCYHLMMSLSFSIEFQKRTGQLHRDGIRFYHITFSNHNISSKVNFSRACGPANFFGKKKIHVFQLNKPVIFQQNGYQSGD